MPVYHLASPLAMLASALSGALSIAVLVVPHLQHGLSPDIVVSVAVAVGMVTLTIVTGVLAHMRGRSVAGAALATLSLAGSLLIVWEQGARRAQSHVAAATSAEMTAAERGRLTRKRSEADEILVTHRRAQATECASGNGKRCQGITYTVATWEAAIAGYDAKLRATPAVVPDAKAERVSTAAGLLGYDVQIARTLVSLIDPLAMPVWLEWVSILCGILAIGKRRISTSAEISARAEVASVSVVSEISSRNLLETSETSRKVKSPAPVIDDDETIVVGLRRLGGEARSQRDLARAMGVSPAECSKRLARSRVVERGREDNRVTVRLRA